MKNELDNLFRMAFKTRLDNSNLIYRHPTDRNVYWMFPNIYQIDYETFVSNWCENEIEIKVFESIGNAMMCIDSVKKFI